MKSQTQPLTESGLSRLYDKFQNHESGAITGFRSDNTSSENKANNREIVAYLRQKGYSLTKVKGSYIENYGSTDQREVGEDSFIVVDHNDTSNLVAELVRLGRRYDQDSVLIVPKGGNNAYLIGTSSRDNAWPTLNQKVTVGSGKFGKTSGEFFSRIKGRQFSFESIAEPATINGIRGEKLLAKEVERTLPVVSESIISKSVGLVLNTPTKTK